MTIQIDLPDRLAREAEEAGLLSPGRFENWLREQLRVAAADRLFAAMDRLHAVNETAFMSPEEVEQEIAAMRSERRSAGSI